MFGARVSPGSDDITLFVPDIEFDETRRNLDQNGVVTVTFVDPVSHQAYQFKGKLIGMRPTSDEERAVQDIYRDKMLTHIVTHTPLPPEIVTGFRIHPSTAVTYRVEQVFLQTPGPGAGGLVDLSAEAG